jgi:hypothetical protein
MSHKATFFLALVYLLVLLVVGFGYSLPIWADETKYSVIPRSFGPVPLGVPWFGALGAVLLSLKGIFDHQHDWNDTYWPWHTARPLVGASLAIVGVLILQSGILAVGSDPTPPPRQTLTQPGPTLTVSPGPTPAPGTGATTDGPGVPGPVSIPIPSNLLYYLVAFVVGYREQTFRSLLKRLTDVLLTPGDEGIQAPSISQVDPPEAPHDVATKVLIVGTGFTNTESVKLGGGVAKFQVDADGQITAETPVVSHAGSAVVSVSNKAGTATYYPFRFL